jgi:hypothetical protein
MIKIKDELGNVVPGILRDPRTHALTNINKLQYQSCLASQLRITQEKNDISNMKNEIVEIKSLLLALLDKLNAN